MKFLFFLFSLNLDIRLIMWDNIRSLHELTVSVLLDGNYDLFPLFQTELGKNFTNLKAVLSNKVRWHSVNHSIRSSSSSDVSLKVIFVSSLAIQASMSNSRRVQ